MREKAKHWWSKIPTTVRKPLVLIIGIVFILAAAATGWLPGPGGIPLFLVGIAILATEFAWAERIRDIILDIIKYIGRHWKAHKVIGTIVAVVGGACGLAIIYWSYTRFG